MLTNLQIYCLFILPCKRIIVALLRNANVKIIVTKPRVVNAATNNKLYNTQQFAINIPLNSILVKNVLLKCEKKFWHKIDICMTAIPV